MGRVKRKFDECKTMGRDLTPKFKRSRREGIDLHPDLDKAGSAKSPLLRKAYKPGQHGPKMTREKVSNYGKQLREKQKAKRIYGLLERQFRNIYHKALRKQGDTGEVVLLMLESRLDNVVYRLGFAKTRPAARQLVTHGHVMLDGKKCNIPSAHVSVGSAVTVKDGSIKKIGVKDMIEKLDRRVPGWLVKEPGGKGKVVSAPELDEPKTLIDIRQIVEFYSR